MQIVSNPKTVLTAGRRSTASKGLSGRFVYCGEADVLDATGLQLFEDFLHWHGD